MTVETVAVAKPTTRLLIRFRWIALSLLPRLEEHEVDPVARWQNLRDALAGRERV